MSLNDLAGYAGLLQRIFVGLLMAWTLLVALGVGGRCEALRPSRRSGGRSRVIGVVRNTGTTTCVPIGTIISFVHHARSSRSMDTRDIRAAGWQTFSGLVLALSGIFGVVYGLMAVYKSSFFAGNAVFVLT